MKVYVPAAGRHLTIGARVFDTTIYLDEENEAATGTSDAGVHPTLDEAVAALRREGPDFLDERFVGWQGQVREMAVIEWRPEPGVLLGELEEVGPRWYVGPDYCEKD